MACGCVPVVVDYGGPGGLVNDTCGTAIPLGNKDALVQSYTRVLEGYAQDPALRKQQSKAAYDRAIQHFSWDAKARKTVEIYKWVTGQRSDKPDFETLPIE